MMRTSRTTLFIWRWRSSVLTCAAEWQSSMASWVTDSYGCGATYSAQPFTLCTVGSKIAGIPDWQCTNNTLKKK
jgi:hypothetical protein